MRPFFDWQGVTFLGVLVFFVYAVHLDWPLSVKMVLVVVMGFAFTAGRLR